MSSFADKYQNLKPGVVAVVGTISTNPDFPDIIGTGFIASEDGIVVTNNHVIQQIRKLPRREGAGDSEWPIRVMYLENIPDKGMITAFLEVEAIGTLEISGEHTGGQDYYYGPDIPDIGFIYLKVRDLPVLKVAENFDLNEGDEVYISGFPMGTRTLRAPGWIHQINPVLQRGIVSAIQPFPCNKPHGVLIDSVVQGGSSGSPIFNPSTGEVVALLYGGLIERKVIPLRGGVMLPYTYGTSLTLAIPSQIISSLLKKVALDRVSGTPDARDTSKFPTLKDFIRSQEVRVREPKQPMPGVEALHPSDLNFKESI